MYNNILIPTDGSEPAVQAAVHGFNLAKWHNASVFVLYVVSEPPTEPIDSAGMFGDPGVTTRLVDVRPFLEELGTEVTDDLASFADELDLEVATEVIAGNPSQTIRTFAEEHEIDLIVMGTHGRSGVDRILQGSVTEEVLRSTEIPLLVIHADDEQAGGQTEE